MSYSAEVVLRTIPPNGYEAPALTTMVLRYPRFIHAEFMTHRAFSRNASSSRATPVKKIIRDVMEDPAMPIHWGKNQPGMQADEECNNPIYCGSYHPGVELVDGEVKVYEDGAACEIDREQAWLAVRDDAVAMAHAFDKAGYHKQIVNRLLEPWSHIKVIVTATDWDNFFLLRRHPAAQPEMRKLADTMWEAYLLPKLGTVRQGYYHIPFITPEEQHFFGPDHETLMAISAARCARVSYYNHDGSDPVTSKDLQLFEKLSTAEPMHASPMEHQARFDSFFCRGRGNLGPWWLQFRQELEARHK